MRFKNFLKKVFYWLEETIQTLRYFGEMLLYENFFNILKSVDNSADTSKRGIVIMGNGPSLKSFLTLCMQQRDALKYYDFFAVNFFASSPEFEYICPKYYVVSDIMFFHDTPERDRVKKMYYDLNRKVTWPMFLFVSYQFAKNSNLTSIITNPNITILPFHSCRFIGATWLRNFLFARGLGNGEYGTVVQNAEYISIQMGFKKIFMTGVDHTFFNDICVDNKNRLCFRNEHYYDNKINEITPIVCNWSGKAVQYTIERYLWEKYLIFHGHSIMRDYAHYRGGEIYNITPNSMIDSLPRCSPESLFE